MRASEPSGDGVYNRINLLSDFFDDFRGGESVKKGDDPSPQPGFWGNKTSSERHEQNSNSMVKLGKVKRHSQIRFQGRARGKFKIRKLDLVLSSMP